jgi:hypothetical protein
MSKSKRSKDSSDQDAILVGLKWIRVAFDINCSRAFVKRALGLKEFHKCGSTCQFICRLTVFSVAELSMHSIE